MQDLDELKHVFLICAEFEIKMHQQALNWRQKPKCSTREIKSSGNEAEGYGRGGEW